MSYCILVINFIILAIQNNRLAMQKRWTLITTMIAIMVVTELASCTKTTTVGLKPILEIKTQAGYISNDTTLAEDTKYRILVEANRSEDQSSLATFEVDRTYQGTLDTTVYYENLTGDKQVQYNYEHDFTTLKKAGTERYTFTVRNVYGITNQKTIVVTVK